MLIVMIGNPVDGFEFFGPFQDYEDATTWATEKGNPDDPWWVVEVAGPNDPPKLKE